MAGKSIDEEAMELMMDWVQRVSEQMGRSVRTCSEWARGFVEALRMRLEVMKIVSSQHSFRLNIDSVTPYLIDPHKLALAPRILVHSIHLSWAFGPLQGCGPSC